VQRPFQEQAYKAIDTLLNILEKRSSTRQGLLKLKHNSSNANQLKELPLHPDKKHSFRRKRQ
jgi:hypothetical protein